MVQGNVCYRNCEHGIYIAGTATGQSWGNTLTGNVCYDNARCGIHLCGQVNCNVHKNSVVGNNCCHNHDGIALDNYARRNTLTGNICTENSRYGIWELGIGPERNIILGNICVSNSSGQIRQDTPDTHTIVEHNQTS